MLVLTLIAASARFGSLRHSPHDRVPPPENRLLVRAAQFERDRSLAVAARYGD
jgi:hypothetical protein